MFFIIKKLTKSTSAAFYFNLFVFENKLDFADNRKTIYNITCKINKWNKKMRNYVKKKLILILLHVLILVLIILYYICFILKTFICQFLIQNLLISFHKIYMCK